MARTTPLLFAGLLLFLPSCLKRELPVEPYDRGDALSAQVCMGPGYRDQVWIDLSDGAVVSTNAKTAWDLAFESSADGWHVMLNGARLMTAWNTGQTDFAAVTDTAGMGAARRIDAPSGNLDSTAIGDWRGTGKVYVIDMGYNSTGQWLGVRKLRMESYDDASFTFTASALDGSGMQSYIVAKDPERTHTCFSFSAGGVVAIEPPAGTWDIVITQYTHQFYEPFLPYIVTGALLDPTTTRVARITDRDFADITAADTLVHPFSPRRDEIGYDWKVYSFDTGSYTIVPGISYIVKDAQGFLHKLRFTDFYGDQGEPGCPSFEVVLL